CVGPGFKNHSPVWWLRLLIARGRSHIFPDGWRRRRLVVRWRRIQRLQRRRRQFWWGRRRFELVAKCERRNFSVGSNTTESLGRFGKRNRKPPVKSGFMSSA